VFDEFN